MDENLRIIEPGVPQVLSFKAAIVVTRRDGTAPSLTDLDTILTKYGVPHSMPGQPDAPVVIALSYPP